MSIIIIIAIVTVVVCLGYIGWMWFRKYMGFIKFGKSLIKAKKSLKHNAGFIFIRNKANSIGMPRIINLEDRCKKIGKKQFLLEKEQMAGLRFMGLPMFIVDSEDSKTSVGLYYHQCDKNGTPLYLKDEKGKYVLDKSNNKIPRLNNIKPSVTLPPDLITAVIRSEAMSLSVSAIFDFMKKNKNLFYFIGAVVLLGVAGGVLSYLNYDILNINMPKVVSGIKNCEATKVICEKILQNITQIRG